MSTLFDVTSSRGKYTVEIKPNAVKELLAKTSGAHVLADEIMKPLLGSKPGITIKSGEDSKEYEAVGAHLKQLRDLQLTNEGTLIAVGGGVIQDIAGFIAAIYMRGVKWHSAPTTLLTMVDSCVGEQSCLNVKGGKNLVGTYHPPAGIAIDPAFITTLSLEQKIAGICEAAKICFAHSDVKTFETYLGIKCLENENATNYEALIAKSLQTKKIFVEADEFGRAERQMLNFGRGFGRALEIASGSAIAPGVSTGLGMVGAIEFQMLAERGYTTDARTVSLRQHIEPMLAKLPALKAEVKKLKADAMFDAFRLDASHTAADYIVIAPDARGMLVRKKVGRGAIGDTQIKQACQRIITLYG